MSERDIAVPAKLQHLRNFESGQGNEIAENAMPEPMEKAPRSFLQLDYLGKWKRGRVGASPGDYPMIEGAHAADLAIYVQHFAGEKRRAVRRDRRQCGGSWLVAQTTFCASVATFIGHGSGARIAQLLDRRCEGHAQGEKLQAPVASACQTAFGWAVCGSEQQSEGV